MNKIIKNFIIILLFLVVLVFAVFNFYKQNNLEDFFLKVLNGYNLDNENVSENLKEWGKFYQNDSFYSDDKKIYLLDGVSAFLEFCDEVDELFPKIDYSELITDDLYLMDISDSESYVFNSEYADVYNFNDNNNVDNRLQMENDKYFIYVKDIRFKDGCDIIESGRFRYVLSEKKYNKLTYLQAQNEMNVSFIDKAKIDGRRVYSFYDSLNKKTIRIALNTICGFLISCEII